MGLRHDIVEPDPLAQQSAVPHPFCRIAIEHQARQPPRLAQLVSKQRQYPRHDTLCEYILKPDDRSRSQLPGMRKFDANCPEEVSGKGHSITSKAHTCPEGNAGMSPGLAPSVPLLWSL